MRQLSPLKIVCDSNVFFASEDISVNRQHPRAERATHLLQLANHHGCQVLLHPATRKDIERAESARLREVSSLKMKQWDVLQPPYLDPTLASSAGYQSPLSERNQVDLEMLAAIACDAADLLVTEDGPLQRHALKAGFGERVVGIDSAIEYLSALYACPPPPPTVREMKAYQLNREDVFFDSLRADYHRFDEWLVRASREHRDCFVVSGASQAIDALAILKTEAVAPDGQESRVLKLCTFKVADHAAGAKRGELLLKSVFQYAATARHELIYVEVLPKHEPLIHLLNAFGFEPESEATTKGEIVLVKHLTPTDESLQWDPLEYHRRLGPPAMLVRDAFVIPVQPRWHDQLFPEAQRQLSLLTPMASGNAIIKAYLTQSGIQTIRRGSSLLFYRSDDLQAIAACGVAEETFRSNEADAIRGFVGIRTVYTDQEIRRKCQDGKPVLAIRFRHDRILRPAWDLSELKQAGVVAGPPQAPQQVHNPRGLEWIRTRLAASH